MFQPAKPDDSFELDLNVGGHFRTATPDDTFELDLDEHICRDTGYSPYVKACPACISQLSKNGAELTQRRKGKRVVAGK